MTFNNPVNITGNVQDVFQIVKKTNRRLLVDNSTVDYTIVGFIINNIDAVA
jgi:hypothetical protein